MQHLKAKLVHALVHHFKDDYRRIEHAINVLHEAEKLSENQPIDHDILVSSALLHDIGIKIAEEKHGYNNGRLQEEYGPPLAQRILQDFHLETSKIEKICEIIGNHHSSSKYPYPELEILKQADGIVNKAEQNKNNNQK